MTASDRRPGATSPAYYLGRPAAFWFDALAPRRPSARPATRRKPAPREAAGHAHDAE